jgi:hypothetical protein
MRIVPSQVIAIIDKYLPWAQDWTTKIEQRSQAAHAAVSWLSGFVDLLEQIPDELLILGTDEGSEFLMARAALRKAAELAVPGKGPVEWPRLGDGDCVAIVRSALEKCADQAPSTSGGGLIFIKDADWRNSLLTDLGEVERALANSEWKSATVLGGSILESMFLWAVNARSADVPTAMSSARNRGVAPSGPPDKWNLYELSEISFELKEITEDTVNTVRPGKTFRNLIHPGRVQRTGVQCDRGTAYTTYGAIFNVVRDLAARHP